MATSTIRLYGDIGADYTGANDGDPINFYEALRAIPEENEIEILIHSPGGSIADGWAICNLLSRRAAKKTAVINGIAASMASVIACACDEVVAPENSLMFIHNPWGAVEGTAEDMRLSADELDILRNQIVGVYAKKTGMETEKIIAMMDRETLLNGEQMVELGFADRLAEPLKMAAKINISRLGSAVAKKIFDANNLFFAGGESETTEEKAIPSDGQNLPEQTSTPGVILPDEKLIAALAEIEELKKEIDALQKENEELKKSLAEKTEMVEQANASAREYEARHNSMLCGITVTPRRVQDMSGPDILAAMAAIKSTDDTALQKKRELWNTWKNLTITRKNARM